MFLRDLKNKIKFTMQRATKGYCDEDLFSIYDWFMKIFPKMLSEFAECTCGYHGNIEELKQEISTTPDEWLESQKPFINKIGQKYDCKYNLDDPMCCWLLIILRMKECFELCDEWSPFYESYWDSKEYDAMNKMLEENKKEAFYLFEKYFFALWW